MPKLIILLFSLALFGCSTSTPIIEWRDPEYSAKLDDIFIIGVSERSERRRAFEDSFIAALSAINVNAVPSHTLIESSSDLTRSSIEKAIEGRDLGAVLITRLVGVEEAKIEPVPTINRYHRSFNGYYDYVAQQNNAGYYSKFHVFSLETHVYDIATRQLVWSLQSEIIDSKQLQVMIDDQIKVTIKALSRQGLLGK